MNYFAEPRNFAEVARYLSDLWRREGTLQFLRLSLTLGREKSVAGDMWKYGVVIGLLSFAFVIYIVFLESLFKQAIINVVLPVYVQHQLGRSETDLGLIIGAIGMGSLLVALPAGVIADKWGVRTGIVAGSALTAAALLVTGLTGYVDVALALALGAGTALLFVGGQAYAIDLAPPGARGQFFGIRASASNAAILLGPLIVGGLTDRLGYAFPFLMLATFVLVSAPMALLATPRRNKAPVLRNEV